jgi:hypothetical protein
MKVFSARKINLIEEIMTFIKVWESDKTSLVKRAEFSRLRGIFPNTDLESF